MLENRDSRRELRKKQNELHEDILEHREVNTSSLLHSLEIKFQYVRIWSKIQIGYINTWIN